MARIENAAIDKRLAGGLPRQAPSSPKGLRDGLMRRAHTLDELESQFVAIATDFQTLFETAGPELCSTAPAPRAWSAAECLHHLNISVDAYFPIWQQVIATAGPRKTELNAPYSIDFFGRLFAWILEPPTRIRSKTPIVFEPAGCPAARQVLADFIERQQRVIGALHRCRGRAIDKVKIASPADARVHYSIWASFVIVAAHQHRHLWQAEQAIKKLQSSK